MPMVDKTTTGKGITIVGIGIHAPMVDKNNARSYIK
jgi:hypothetical protein